MKIGEDNTNFFHAMATQRYRRNTISSLKMENGEVTNDHVLMAGIAWESFKRRMGQSTGIEMGFQLQTLLQRVSGLDVLSRPFEKEEMDLVIKQMPASKAPGPDGFNGMFLKKCWPIVCQDFYNLANDFHAGKVNLESINTSFITLIPKIGTPKAINDFRPISLTNVCMKFLTKIAANRLQDHILRCVHRNQYGFLKSRTIQDCLAWSFEYLYKCQASKRPVIILKIDFEKAFDTIEHEAIVQIIRAK